jgi:hypothetical protein
MRASTAREEASAAQASAVRRARESELAESAATLERAIVADSALYAPASMRFARPGEESARASRDDRERLADACRHTARDAVRDAIDGYVRERDELLARDHAAMAAYLDRRLQEHVEAGAGRALGEVTTVLARDRRERFPADDALAIDATAIARGFVSAGHRAVDERLSRASNDVEGGLVRAVLSVLAARLRTLAAPGESEAAAALPRAREIAALAAVLAAPPVAEAKQA